MQISVLRDVCAEFQARPNRDVQPRESAELTTTDDVHGSRVQQTRRITSEQYSQYVRRHVAAALPEICQGLADKAKNGDVACAKALWHMAGLDVMGRNLKARTPNTGLAFARKILAEFRD